jgi:hypothetical protein
MMNDRFTLILSGLLSVVLAGIGCYGAVYFSHLSFLSGFFPSLHFSSFVKLFEHHFWQFVFSIIVIVILSRGHLWSYGINSKNLKLSMKYLGWIYLTTIVLTGILFITGIRFSPVPPGMLPLGIKNSLTAMLVYWMSAPVANTILFFGFGQTVISKRFSTLGISDPFQISVIVPSVLFVLYSSATQFSGMEIISQLCALCIAMVSGIIYKRTDSLFAPMLGQAFFFGFPLFVEIVSTIRL